MKKQKKSVIQTITTILFVLVIVLCLPLVVPKFFGLTPYNVISGSMKPTIPVGSVVYASQVPIESLTSGDIIVFSDAVTGNSRITHRIVEVDEANRQFRTKGDANTAVDPSPVAFHHVLGKVVFHLPVLGAISELCFAGNHKLILLALFVLALVLCFAESILKKTEEGKSAHEEVEEADGEEISASISRGGKKKKSMLPEIIIIVLALVLLIGGGLGIFFYQRNYKQSNDLYAGLEAEYVNYEAKGAVNQAEEFSWDQLVNVDFYSLMTANPEVCGWIYLENEELSYPIMYSGDNDKYLRTGFDGKDATAGSIFLEAENRFDFSDSHTIIYGHNMRNLSMFGKLKFYHQKENYFEEHPFFQIITPVVKYRYQVFAYEDVSEDSFIYTVPFGDTPEFADFIKEIQRHSQVKTDIAVSSADHVVTLSTCSTTGRRFVVHGVLCDVSLIGE